MTMTAATAEQYAAEARLAASTAQLYDMPLSATALGDAAECWDEVHEELAAQQRRTASARQRCQGMVVAVAALGALFIAVGTGNLFGAGGFVLLVLFLVELLLANDVQQDEPAPCRPVLTLVKGDGDVDLTKTGQQ